MRHRSLCAIRVVLWMLAAIALFTACTPKGEQEFLNDMREITRFEKPTMMRSLLEEVWKYQFLFWQPDEQILQGRTLGGTKRKLGHIPKDTVIMGYARNGNGEILLGLADLDFIYAERGGLIPTSFKNARLQLIRPDGEPSLEFEVAGTPIRGIKWKSETTVRYSTDGGLFEIDVVTGLKTVLHRDKIKSHFFTGRSGEECWYLARDSLFVLSDLDQPPKHALGAAGSTGFLPGPEYRSALIWDKKGNVTCHFLDGSRPLAVEGAIRGRIIQFAHTPGSSRTVIISQERLTGLATDSFGGAIEGEDEGLDHFVYQFDWVSMRMTPVAAFRDHLLDEDIRPIHKVILISGDGRSVFLWVKDEEKGYLPFSVNVEVTII